MKTRNWLADLADADLGIMHHALRMLLQHPHTSEVDREQAEALADAAWNEIVRRSGTHPTVLP